MDSQIWLSFGNEHKQFLHKFVLTFRVWYDPSSESIFLASSILEYKVMEIDFSRYRKDDDTAPVDNLQTLKSIGANG